jgi:hypothetical protein
MFLLYYSRDSKIMTIEMLGLQLWGFNDFVNVHSILSPNNTNLRILNLNIQFSGIDNKIHVQ